MAVNSLIKELISYFKAYAEGFHARNGTQIAEFYCTPRISMRADASMHCCKSRPETERFFQGVADTYYEEGLRRSETKNPEVVPVGGRSLLATMDWAFSRGDGTLLKQWRQS